MGILDFLRRSAAPQPRREPVFVRSYSGASSAARYSDFGTSYLSADAELETALPKLRARSRNLERNNPHARRFMALMQDNVVGATGFQLRVSAKRTDGPNAQPDNYGNDLIAARWAKWCKSATADGMMTFREASRMAVRTWARDGEVLVHFRMGREFPDGIALRFYEADHLDETLNRAFPGTGNRIRMGVEIDADEKPIAYHILTTHPGETVWSTNNRRYRRIPASEMLHLYIKSRAGQTRGEPPMCVVLTDVKMIAGYREAEVTNRRVAAAKMGFFERDENAGPVKGVADSVTPEGQLEMDVEPGRMTALPPGYRFNPFNPNTSSTDFAGFERQMIRSIAAGLGVSYFDLAMDLSDVSYSSVRQGALSDRDFYRGMQAFFIERFAMIVYAKWLQNLFDFGNIGIPDYRYEKFLDASSFRGRGWSWVDPQKEVDAAIKAREGRMNSLQNQVAETGMDWWTVADEIAEEDAYLDGKGIPVISKNQPAQQPLAQDDPTQ